MQKGLLWVDIFTFWGGMNQNLLERVERLERRNKLLLGILMFLTVVIGVMLRQHYEDSSSLKPPERIVAGTIEVDRLIAGSVEVVGSYGKNSVSLGASNDGWVDLSFRDLKGVLRGGMLLTPSGKLSLDYFSDKVARANLGVVDTKNGEEYSLVLRDAKGKVIWQPSAQNPY